MPAEKFGVTDRSVKFARPPCTVIFLIDTGMVAGADARSAAGLTAAVLVAAVFIATALSALGAGAAGVPAALPGPVNTRFTFKVLSDSMMTRAYGLVATISVMASRSGARR